MGELSSAKFEIGLVVQCNYQLELGYEYTLWASGVSARARKGSARAAAKIRGISP